MYFNEQLQDITQQSNVPIILFVQKTQQIRFNKTLPLEACLLQPVWFTNETYKICCFTHVGGYSFLPSLYLPWQCRKGNNPIQTHRLQEHIQQEKLTGKRFRKHAAYTRMGIDTEKKTELVKRQGLQSHEELKNISQKTGIRSGCRVEVGPCKPKYCCYTTLNHPKSTSIMYTRWTSPAERNSRDGHVTQYQIVMCMLKLPKLKLTASWQDTDVLMVI